MVKKGDKGADACSLAAVEMTGRRIPGLSRRVGLRTIYLRISIGILLIFRIADTANARDLPSTLKSPLSQSGRCSGYFRDDFTSNLLKNASGWDGKRYSANWLDEFSTGACIHDGVLQLDLRRRGAERGKEVAVSWSGWFQFGRVCASLKIGKGNGIVSALFLASYAPGHEIDDEVDFEWVGNNIWNVQSNWFAEDRAVYAANSRSHGIADSFSNFQTVCIERTGDYVKWEINGNAVRQIPSSTPGFPTRPAKLILDIWDGGRGTSPGIMSWAGGWTDWNNEENPDYRVQVDWVSVDCWTPDSRGDGTPCQSSNYENCTSGCCVQGKCGMSIPARLG